MNLVAWLRARGACKKCHIAYSELKRRIDTEDKILYYTVPAILPGQGIQIVLGKKQDNEKPKKKK